MRLRAVVVLVTTIVALLTASLRAPSFDMFGAAVVTAVSAPDPDGETWEVADTFELTRVPAVRPSRSDGPRALRVYGARGSVVSTAEVGIVPVAASHLAEASRTAQRAWSDSSWTHAELMVFLN